MLIRTRLTIQFILIVAGILLLSLFFIYFKFKSYVEDEFYNALRSKAAMTAEMIVKNDTPKPSPESENSLLITFSENVMIYDHQNKLVYAFNHSQKDIMPEDLEDIRSRGYYRIAHEQFSGAGITYTNKKGESFIIIAEAIFDSGELFNLRTTLIFDFFIIITIVSLGGWFFSGQALAPVKRIMDQLDSIRPTDLSKRLPIENKNELSKLVTTFNSLLDRIESAFDEQKRFISNVSHELKNPLTIISTQLEVTLQKERDNETYKNTLTSVLEDTRTLANVSDNLLQLAKINSKKGAIPFEKVRLDEVIWQVKANILKIHPYYKITFEILHLPEEEENLFIQANETLLKTALSNLIDNGCKYSEDKKVTITLDYTDKLSVSIQDFGQGISAEERLRIFEPFYRSEQHKSMQGAGVGLSLVESILQLHRIQLEINSVKGEGSVFKLLF
jgi:signal transduction histidine kinase